ncbi:hypothetical protein HK405_006671 [Cladochytrium tenue]|nr:hypothetical protein HK405_006671 [Cladochytrium tenue]
MPLSLTPMYNPDGSYDYSYSLFGEKPNKQLAYVAAAVFVVTAIVHLAQAIRFKTRYMAPAIIGALMEALGYFARTKAIDDPFNTSVYAVQQFFIVIAPVLVAATQYITLEHIMVHVDSSLAPVRPSLVAKIFVGGDAVSFVVQAAGSGLLVGGTTMDMVNTGNWILIGGLLLQILSFSCFLVLCVVFNRRAARAQADRAEAVAAAGGAMAALPASHVNPRWPALFLALMFGSACVMIRSVFRVIEFAKGYDGPIATNEIYMYVFDTILMAVALYILNFVHPGVALRPVKGAVPQPVEMLETIMTA